VLRGRDARRYAITHDSPPTGAYGEPMRERPGSGRALRRRFLRRTVLMAPWAAPWVLATLAGLVIAATTRIGPTLLQLSERHGVHLGDLLAFALAYAMALAVTLAMRRTRRRRRGPAGAPPRPGRAAPR
jgi:hypothetical protein